MSQLRLYARSFAHALVLLVAFSSVPFARCFSAAPSPEEPAHRLWVRERHLLDIDGVQEAWSLAWGERPEDSNCNPSAVYMAITCPCQGFGYAQQGHLFLTREGPAILGDLAEDPKLAAEIRRRPEPDVMQFADYGGDGRPTQFLLQVGNLPCGKHQLVAVGITKTSAFARSAIQGAHRYSHHSTNTGMAGIGFRTR